MSYESGFFPLIMSLISPIGTSRSFAASSGLLFKSFNIPKKFLPDLIISVVGTSSGFSAIVLYGIKLQSTYYFVWSIQSCKSHYQASSSWITDILIFLILLLLFSCFRLQVIPRLQVFL